MYRYDHRNRHPWRKFAIALSVFAVIVAIGTIIALRYLVQPNTQLSQAPATVTPYGQSGEKSQQITENDFNFSLPANWKKQEVPKGLYTLYRWHGTSTDDSPRILDIYEDALPLNLPVNRMLPLEADGDRLTIVNTVSDNCANFSTAAAGTHADTAPAKWSGVDFICDMLTTTRNVTGTSSASGINRVTLQGVKGKHQFFFVYTDNSSSPDYTIFTDALQSFRVK